MRPHTADRRPTGTTRAATATLVVVLTLALAGCGDEDGDTDGAADGADPVSEGAGAVAIVDDDTFAFDPDQVTVAAGETVTWTHEGSVAHTVTAEDGSFDSGSLSGGDTFEETFEDTGTYAYVCSIHPSMQGSVTVE